MVRNLGPAMVLALVLGLASACSDDEPSTDPGPSQSPASSEASTEPTMPSSSDTGTPSPSVEPAAGATVRLDRLSMRAPEGWDVTKEGDPYSAQVGQAGSSIYIQEFPDFGGGVLSLDQIARTRVRNGPYLREPKILAPVSIVGLDWYHLAGRTNEVTYTEDFGTVVDGLALLVAMSFDSDLPAAERRVIVEQVLASVAFE